MAIDPFVPLVADRAPLNAVKWAARDYASTFDALFRRLKSLYLTVYNDYATTIQGIMLIEMMAYATAQIQWYMDRIASDAFLETARTPEAANRIVKQIGYKMRPAATASTLVDLGFPDGSPGPFTMLARWRYQGPSGLVFESYAPLVEAAAIPVTVPPQTRSVAVYQGETRILTFTSDGTSNQTYALSGVPEDSYVAHLSVEGWVDGLEWEERDFLTYVADEQFEVDYADNPPKIRFGDGIAGLAPPLGSEVKFRFVVIKGTKGNEAKAHSITSSIDTLTIGGTTVTFTVDNAEAPTGGADPETTDHARRIAPMSFAARGAAITAPDYDALSNSFTDPLYGAVAKAYAFNPRGTYSDLTFNNIVEQVELLLSTYVGVVSSLEDDIVAASATLTPLSTVITDAMVDLEAIRADMVSNVGTAKANMQGARAQCTMAETAINTTKATVDAQKVLLDDLHLFVTGEVIDPATKTRILTDLAAASVQSTTASTNSTSALGNVQTAGTALDTTVSQFINPVLDDLTNVAPVAPDTSIPVIISDVNSAIASIQAALAVLDAKAIQIDGTAATLETDVNIETANMRSRIAALFSDDCMSNYVQVPILSLDADGNYVAPSVGLIHGLQAYLDTVKEVTQQVEVVDGTPGLVQATIEVEILVNSAYIYEEEASKVQSAIVELLKGRDFNQPLYESDLYKTVQAASIGIEYANIQITGPVAQLDADNNLVPSPNRIIVLANGGLTITRLYE